MRSKHISRIVAPIVAACAFFAQPHARAQATAESGGGADPLVALDRLSASYESLVQRVLPSVVQVFAAGYAADPSTASSPGGLIAKERSTGSGVILDSAGYIVTNAHVVVGAGRVEVMLPGAPPGGEAMTSILKPRGRIAGAQVVGFDRETDLAVLRVEQAGLPALDLGDSDDVRHGQLVFAFGSPLGLESSVSAGVVSGVARQLEPDAPMIYIQTDASINPGNSGGPLVDASGRVVGINTFILSQSGGNEGLGFAAPSNIVRNVYEQIRKTGRVRRGEIGARAQTITPALARGLGLDREWGVILGDVEPGGSAEKAGLRAGDVVLSLDGKAMENGRQFDVNLYRRGIGETVKVEVQRGSEKRTYPVQVVERPDDPARFASLVNPEQNLIPQLGVLAVEIDPRIAAYLPGLRVKRGVLIAARSATGRPWEQGFEPGDVLRSLNGVEIATLEGLRTQAAALKKGDAAVAQVERDGELLYVAFEME